MLDYQPGADRRARRGRVYRQQRRRHQAHPRRGRGARRAVFRRRLLLGRRSVADDLYTRSKTAQERLFDESSVPHAVLRPTLMFGWFDRKHLGWLRRFMDRTPVFPIPGDGNYRRQPLYVGDFVAIVTACFERRLVGTWDISGRETIPYGELIAMIHGLVRPRARIVRIPYRLFWLLLAAYALIDRNPPFTTAQLEALVIPETFPVIDWPSIFSVRPTPLREALAETFLDEAYGNVALEF